MKYLLQSGDICAAEKRAVRKISSDVIFSTFENLSNIEPNFIPIGSVEFCSEYLKLNNKEIPKHISYPKALLPFLKRDIKQEIYENVQDDYFVKPVEQIKLFTGHIKGEEHETLPEKINNVLVWSSPKVTFVAEWRYYIKNKEILGFSRYDDSDDEYPEPNIEIVHEAIKIFDDSPIAYVLDFGLLDNEEIALVEVNDAWALGYYTWGNMSEEKYVEMITERWKEIIK
jgi:hypothetical protein